MWWFSGAAVRILFSVFFFHPLGLCCLVQLCFAARRQFFSEVRVSAVQGRKLDTENFHGEASLLGESGTGKWVQAVEEGESKVS